MVLAHQEIKMVGVQAVCPDLVTGCNHAVIFLAFFCKISQAKITAVFNQARSHVHSLYNLEFQPSPGFLFPEQLVDGNRQCAVDTGGYDDGHGLGKKGVDRAEFLYILKTPIHFFHKGQGFLAFGGHLHASLYSLEQRESQFFFSTFQDGT